ncbi:MAG: cytochrome c3 family protein [candidate division NC10 bacterium]|nr:cytochrome c3 family protein [candidate division NC10 bacterium]
MGKHRGVLLMYLGMGGRGTPMIPSHMFQVRVECVACHIAPKEAEPRAGIVGQTFRPTEQACIACHGEKYRGMLERWASSLTRMSGAIAPKLAGARGALTGADPKNPKHGRARRLVDDAEFNVEFVALARGVHNVFYAADLLKVANGWLDEAFALLGKAPVKTDDALVRGGYCGVLCHEQAGVRLPDTVSFGKQKVPHARHVTEFGAVCTACHSPEVHKAVTATAATCTGCHHSPQNERCESCHRVQSAFYRGETQTALVTVEPNGMAPAVSCTGCHDFTQRHSRQAVGVKCAACHDAAYLEFLRAWTSGLDREAAGAGDALKRAEAAVAAARRAGRAVPEAEAAVREAREALALVRSARPVHNPAAGEALLEAARRRAEEAAAGAGRR